MLQEEACKNRDDFLLPPRHIFLPILVEFGGGFNITDAVEGDVSTTIFFEEASDIMAGHALVFGALDTEGLAPQVQASFKTHRAIVGKLVVNINMGPIVIPILN